MVLRKNSIGEFLSFGFIGALTKFIIPMFFHWDFRKFHISDW
ncbi:hypothetical protein LSS_16581 [Leptospira santarosai serovar Shermani str. LT 821]|uniref:Uncharacterized protein n=1 Tax=Leptospira santarosai serovar Shermani str. LT 821 TaxID=758847 RepID=K8XVU3_9LEPT|nr:hypothetical protein LSS_16581 [Leptospira santarosai serovar Shermani str. LT 821]